MMRAGGNAQHQDHADDGLTVVLARERFMVTWDPRGLQLHLAGLAGPHAMSAREARHLAELLIAAADLEEAA